jgi:HEAT repeat protein
VTRHVHRKRFLVPLAILLLALAGVLGWHSLVPRDRLLHGKREREWIKSIKYEWDPVQIQEWKALGPDGLHLLARTLDRGRLYRRTYRWMMPRLPGRVNALLYPLLPKPSDSHATRMCVIFLLSNLGKDAKPVEPAIARALRDDDEGVRLSALGCYEELPEVMSDNEKLARLPELLRAAQDRDENIRNNAAVALRWYAGHGAEVAPVLIKGLHDPYIHGRMQMAKALARVDLPAGLKAGLVPVVIEILKNPDDQVAYQAAELLGEMGAQPELAVPALAAAAQSTNTLVASTAKRALMRFPTQPR